MYLVDAHFDIVQISDDVASMLQIDLQLHRLKRSYLTKYGEHIQARRNGDGDEIMVYDTLTSQGIFIDRTDALQQLSAGRLHDQA